MTWTTQTRQLSINYFAAAGLNNNYCLNLLFTVKSRPPGAMHLSQRGHDFVLPNIKYEFNKHHFIARSLFGYV